MNVQRAFITGIHTGLGNALAHALLERGADVFAISRRLDDDLKHASRLRFRCLDLAESDRIEPVLRELLSGTDHLDLVVLNAGVLGEIKDLSATSLAEISNVMKINVWANKLIHDALRAMAMEVAQLVAISSGAAVNGSAGWGAYSMSKSALNLMFRVYANENPDTHYTCLAPGLVHTQMLDYVCSLDTDDRYPAVGRIRGAFGTDGLQSPLAAAERLLEVLPELRQYPSGAFVDIRQMN